jgi:hypothetical protein
MSLRTRTWDRLLKTISGKFGQDVEKSTYLDRVRYSINQAALELHEYYKWMSRFLVVSEPRTVLRGQIESEENSFYVYGAGTQDVNGLYVQDPSGGTGFNYVGLLKEGDTVKYYLYYSNNVLKWLIGTVLYDEEFVLYNSSFDTASPSESTWEVQSLGGLPAEEPGPIVQQLSEIGTMLHVDRCNIYQDRTSDPIEFYSQGGFYPLNTKNAPDIAYCTYQKPLNVEYGEGVDLDIPEEMFNYMVLYAVRDLQLSQRQSNPNALYGVVTDRQLQSAFESVGQTADYERTISNVAIRTQTHLKEDNTLY